MQEKPNVILMFVDDLGYGDLSCYNEHSKIHTPHIDILADTGIRLTDCHATSSLCTPSRYGLLTGRYNWRSRLKQSVLPGGADPLIEPGRQTIANLFQKHGYYTAAVGKWHLGLGWERTRLLDGKKNQPDTGSGAQSRAFRLDGLDIDFTKSLTISPNDFGFDYFFGTAASLDQPPYTYIENRCVLDLPDHISGVFPLDRVGASQQKEWQRGPMAPNYRIENVIDDMHKKVLELIESHAGKPFFLYYPTHAVHGPLLPPADYKGKSGMNAYGDMVLYLDYLVGTMQEKLSEMGILQDTIFIFASDNGCSGVADYPLLTSRGHNPSYIFRGKKGDIYEGGHRIPAIFSWPGHINAQICSQMACLCDLYATFAELLGEKLPADAAEDSISLLPALKENIPVRESVVHSSGKGCFSIRTQEWKLELCRTSGGLVAPGAELLVEPTTSKDVPYQLYHLVSDVREQKNVAADYPDICLAMVGNLIKIIQNGRTTQGEPQENAGMDDWQQLKELGNLIEKIRKNAEKVIC